MDIKAIMIINATKIIFLMFITKNNLDSENIEQTWNI